MTKVGSRGETSRAAEEIETATLLYATEDERRGRVPFTAVPRKRRRGRVSVRAIESESNCRAENPGRFFLHNSCRGRKISSGVRNRCTTWRGRVFLFNYSASGGEHCETILLKKSFARPHPANRKPLQLLHSSLLFTYFPELSRGNASSECRVAVERIFQYCLPTSRRMIN